MKQDESRNYIMKNALQARLNKIAEKILAEDFLKSEGLGGDLNFLIFDYDPQDELQIREYLSFLIELIDKKHKPLRVCNINLLKVMRAYLDDRDFTAKAIQKQLAQGDDALLKALAGPLHVDKFVPFMMEHCQVSEQDMVLISGVGSVWPVMRAHALLNKLHAMMGDKPLILFYPGVYSGQTLTLFNRVPSNPYYRAFQLVP